MAWRTWLVKIEKPYDKAMGGSAQLRLRVPPDKKELLFKKAGGRGNGREVERRSRAKEGAVIVQYH